jgi:X-X-X-Leu-X-X-Gly heptad repeat protein
MPANAVDYADENTAAANGAQSKQLAAEAQRVFAEARGKIQAAVQDGLEQLRAQSRTYADGAGQQLDVAQQYVTERVRERPLAATGAALGVGVLIGLLLSSGRR